MSIFEETDCTPGGGIGKQGRQSFLCSALALNLDIWLSLWVGRSPVRFSKSVRV